MEGSPVPNDGFSVSPDQLHAAAARTAAVQADNARSQLAHLADATNRAATAYQRSDADNAAGFAGRSR
jgi:hypothetical protein